MRAWWTVQILGLAIGVAGCGQRTLHGGTGATETGGSGSSSSTTAGASGESTLDDGAVPTEAYCGDGIVVAPEQCDDANFVANDGCEPSCRLTPPALLALSSNAGNATCAVRSGELQCWGTWAILHTHGDAACDPDVPFPQPCAETQCCIGDDEHPADVPPVAIGGAARALAVDWTHACVGLDAGVRCWGRLSAALGQQLGSDCCYADGEQVSDLPLVDLPAAVVRVVTSYGVSCALVETGEVYCFGDPVDGQTGYGGKYAEQGQVVGRDISPLDAGPVDVGASVIDLVHDFRTCAITLGHTLRCWGGCYVQGAVADGHCLGYGNDEIIGDDETPADAGDVPIDGRVLVAAIGGNDTCVIVEPGELQCSVDGGPFTAIALGDALLDIELGASAASGCMLVEGGDVRCWGSSDVGALGLGYIPEQPVAIEDAMTVPLPGPVAAIAMNADDQVCAVLTDASVYCWGRDWDPCLAGDTSCHDEDRPHGYLGYPGPAENVGDDETPLEKGPVAVFP